MKSGMRRSTWRLDFLFVALIAVLMFNVAYFNGCRCWQGAWIRMQRDTAALIAGLIVVRFLAAWAFKEKNDGWKVYLAILGFSPFLVSGIYLVASTFLPSELRQHSH